MAALLDAMRAVPSLTCWKKDEWFGQVISPVEAVRELVAKGFSESSAREALESLRIGGQLGVYSFPNENRLVLYLTPAMKAWMEQQDSSFVGEPLDGPVSPDGFRHKTVIHRGITRQAFQVVNVLWSRSPQNASFANLQLDVQGAGARRSVKHQLEYVRKTANKFFLDNAIPFHVSVDTKRKIVYLSEGMPRHQNKQPRRRR